MPPRTAVIGLGEYFDRLFPSIAENFSIACLSDIDPGKRKKLSDKFSSLFLDPRDLAKLDVDCYIVLTPPNSHLFYINLLSKFNKPIFVEKPLVPNLNELSVLENNNPFGFNLYCSDLYLDGKAKKFIDIINKKITDNGTLRIEGVLYEGETEITNSFGTRSWLWEKDYGGVTLDLLYHYLILIFKFYPDCEIAITKKKLMTFEKDFSTTAVAETNVEVTGIINGSIHFDIKAGKFKNETKRYLKFIYKSGFIQLDFGKNNTVTVASEGSISILEDIDDPINRLIRDYRAFVNKKGKSHNWNISRKSVKLADKIRKND